MRSTTKLKKGYTLIETIVYLALLAILVTAIVWSLTAIVKSYKRMKAVRTVEVSAITAMDRMTREIRDGTSVNQGASTFNNSNGVLTLSGVDGSGTSETLKFYLSAGRVYVDQNGTTLGPLTLSGVTVSNLTFRYFSNTNSSGVKIEMTMSDSPAPTSNFYDSALLRGSYSS